MAAGDESLRRRPVSGLKRTSSSSREPANQDNSDSRQIFAAVVRELATRVNAFVRELKLREVKPWSEFFARFKAPKAWNAKALDERMSTNFPYYRGNYSIVAAGFLIVGIMWNPYVLLALLFCSLLLAFLFPGGDHRIVALGERKLEGAERTAVAVIGVAGVVGLSRAWYVILVHGGAGALLCLLHAVFRPRSMSSKAGRASANARAAAGGMTIEAAQNFVENVFGMNPHARTQ